MRTFEDIIEELAENPIISADFHLCENWGKGEETALFVTDAEEEDGWEPIALHRDGKAEMSGSLSPEQMVAVATACAEIARLGKERAEQRFSARRVASIIRDMEEDERARLAEMLPNEVHGVFLVDYDDPDLAKRVAEMLMHPGNLPWEDVNSVINGDGSRYFDDHIYLSDTDPVDLPTHDDINEAREKGAREAREEMDFELAHFDEDTRLHPSGQTALDFLHDYTYRQRGKLAPRDDANFESLTKLFEKGGVA